MQRLHDRLQVQLAMASWAAVQVFRANGFGERWLLATPRDAHFYAMPPMAPATLRDVMAFVSVADCMALGDFLGVRNDRSTLIRAVEDHLKWGSLLLMKETRPRLKLDPRKEPPPPPYEPIPDDDPIVDDPRALRIVDCPPVFEPRKEKLRITYLLRALGGKHVELVIRSKAKPEPPVHRVLLSAAQTKDGSSVYEWDGRDDQSGKPVDRTRSPFVVHLVHDGTYKDSAPTSIPPASLVHVVEMEDLLFATGRAIVMPDGGVDEQAEGEARITGLHAIAAALRFAAFHTDKRLCVFGHTDTVGQADDNLALSRERATNVLHLLRGESDAWASHCDAHFEIADVQRILKWIALTKGWQTDPGEIDNEFGQHTRAARSEFRARMNAEYGTALEQGSKQSVDDWRAYFTLFDEALAAILHGTAHDLARIRGKLQPTEPAALGCGEAFPAESPGVNNLESASNRRVDLVFFDPDEVPPELGADPPGAALYGSSDYVAEYLPIGKDGGTVPVILRLLYAKRWLSGTKYRIELDGELLASGTTNADGWVVAELPRDTPGLRLVLPTLKKSFPLEVATLEPISTLAGVQGRLANLGFLAPASGQLDDLTREALRAFQAQQQLPVTGEPDGDTIARLREIHDEY